MRSINTSQYTVYFDVKDIDTAYISKLVPDASEAQRYDVCSSL